MPTESNFFMTTQIQNVCSWSEAFVNQLEHITCRAGLHIVENTDLAGLLTLFFCCKL